MNINFYNQSVSCTITKIEHFLNSILSIDPSAIIILQGDHGPNFNYDFNLHPNSMDRITLRERFSIHNSIRLPERCDFDANTIIGNVETINIVINCISNEEVKNFNNKSYAGFYENNKEMFGKLIEVTDYLK